jgi:hypothetical protein
VSTHERLQLTFERTSASSSKQQKTASYLPRSSHTQSSLSDDFVILNGKSSAPGKAPLSVVQQEKRAKDNTLLIDHSSILPADIPLRASSTSRISSSGPNVMIVPNAQNPHRSDSAAGRSSQPLLFTENLPFPSQKSPLSVETQDSFGDTEDDAENDNVLQETEIERDAESVLRAVEASQGVTVSMPRDMTDSGRPRPSWCKDTAV